MANIPQGTNGTAVNPQNWNVFVDKINDLVNGINTLVAFTDGDATPSVSTDRHFKTANTSPTTITMFDDGTDGKLITVLIDDANTTIDFTSTNLKGNGGADWSPSSGDIMTGIYDGTNWYFDVTTGTPTFVTITLTGALIATVDAFVDADDTPSVSGGTNFLTANTGATTITQFDDGVNGQMISIIAGDDNTTIADNANIKHNAGSARLLGQYDIARFIHNGTLWVGAGYEQNTA